MLLMQPKLVICVTCVRHTVIALKSMYRQK